MIEEKDSVTNYFQESSKVIASLSSEIEFVKEMANAIHESNNKGGKVLTGGNAGS